MCPRTLDRITPDASGSFWLARLIGFFRDEFGADLARLPISAPPIAGFSLEEVLTSQRHASFPLDTVRGWKGLAGVVTGRREQGRRVFPRLGDALAIRRYAAAEARARDLWMQAARVAG